MGALSTDRVIAVNESKAGRVHMPDKSSYALPLLLLLLPTKPKGASQHHAELINHSHENGHLKRNVSFFEHAFLFYKPHVV